jgi:hypothetical protein
MRLVTALVAICALSQSAFAQSECKAITDADTRLACYDRNAGPALRSAGARPSMRTTPVPKSDAANNADPIGAEDALMNARLRNICRGC